MMNSQFCFIYSTLQDIIKDMEDEEKLDEEDEMLEIAEEDALERERQYERYIVKFG